MSAPVLKLVQIGLVAVALLLTIVACATPIYTGKFEQDGKTLVTFSASVWKKKWTSCKAEDAVYETACDNILASKPFEGCSYESRLNTVAAFLILSLLAAAAALAVSAINFSAPKVPAPAAPAAILVAMFCVFISWTVTAGTYHMKCDGGAISDSEGGVSGTYGPQLGLAITSWLLLIGGTVVSVLNMNQKGSDGYQQA